MKITIKNKTKSHIFYNNNEIKQKLALSVISIKVKKKQIQSCVVLCLFIKKTKTSLHLRGNLPDISLSIIVC